MREILFRGKRLDNGIWITGAYHPGGGRHFIFPLALATDTSRIKVVPETVGQFTGKQDKTGRKIFEGDILRVIERGETLVGDVVFNTDRGEWVVQGEDGSFCNMAKRKDVEIIGNIHDKPELLKEGDTDGKERTE